MSDSPCPTATELDRAFGSAAPELVAHVASCPACTAVWTETAEAIALVRDLPAELPPAPHREEQRTALLAAFEHRPTTARRHGWLAPAATTAAAASVLFALWPRAADTPAPVPAPTPASAHVVHPHAGAHYTIAAEPPDEIVRLREGTIDVDVRPLRPGERFRVIVGADQLEVHGTSFEVVAAGDHLVSVHVVHGRVEVRRVGSAPAFVAGGQSWHAITAVAGPPAPARAPPPRVEHAAPPPARAVARVPEPAEPPPPAPTAATDPQETAFVAGWDAMRRGELAVAADAFARAVALDPHGDLAEDGTFWHAVAVARLHRTEEAIVALRGFIGAYPASTRAGEASVMLGWILVDRNQLDEARLRFQAAIRDPSESVQTSARAGLAALDRARR
jgi:TolA-binding protein